MLINCGASDWRRALRPIPRWSRTSNARPWMLGLSARTLGADTPRQSLPRPLCNSMPGRSWCVPLTSSPRHLTFHLFHSYISTAHSLHPQGLCFIPFCVSIQATSLRFQDNERVIGILVAIRVGQDPRITQSNN